MDYREVAHKAGVRDYLRVPTVGTRPEFISGLAELVLRSLERTEPCGKLCPEGLAACGWSGR